jgi:hypothetical protein
VVDVGDSSASYGNTFTKVDASKFSPNQIAISKRRHYSTLVIPNNHNTGQFPQNILQHGFA